MLEYRRMHVEEDRIGDRHVMTYQDENRAFSSRVALDEIHRKISKEYRSAGFHRVAMDVSRQCGAAWRSGAHILCSNSQGTHHLLYICSI